MTSRDADDVPKAAAGRTRWPMALGLGTAAALVCLGAGSSPPAPIQVHLFVAKASNQGTEVDKRLAHFAEDVKKTLRYKSFTVADEQTLKLEAGKPAKVDLPGGGKAEIEFRQVDTDGKLRVRIEAKGNYVTTSIPDGKEFYFQAGSHGGADLWLILEPKAK